MMFGAIHVGDVTKLVSDDFSIFLVVLRVMERIGNGSG